MTTFHQTLPPQMGLPAVDESMDTTTSPYPHNDVELEDLDLEFDQMENEHLLPSDKLMDDTSNVGDVGDEHVQEDDASMRDDDNAEFPDGLQDHYTFEDGHQHDPQPDDEILYDDEGDDTAIVDQVLQSNDTETDDGAGEEDLFDFDDTDQVGHDDSIAAIPEPATHPTSFEQAQEHPAHPGPTDGQDLDSGSSHAQAQEDEVRRKSVGNQDATITSETHDDEDQIDYSDNQANEHEVERTENTLVEVPNEEPEPEASHEQLPTTDLPASTIDIANLGPHFVTLRFENVDYPLFTDEDVIDSQAFPLPDAQLIFSPLDRLLEICRERIYAINPHHPAHLDEVVFSIPSLGLQYCEDSKYSAQRTLAEILQLYVSLKQNENAQSISPLFCQLSTRTCLATQYDWLQDEARKKMTYQTVCSMYAGDADEIDAGADHEEVATTQVAAESALAGDNQEADHENEAEDDAVTSGQAADTVQPKVDAILSSTVSGSVDPQESEEHAQAAAPALTTTTELAQTRMEQTDEDQGDEALDFFEEAYQNEAEANEVELTEEALEQAEDQKVLEHVQAELDAGRGSEYQEGGEDTTQIDYGDDVEPFKAIAEEEQIAIEEEDLFLEPDEPLQAAEDPDALLENRAIEAVEAYSVNESTASNSTKPVNGNHTSNGVTATTQPSTPGKNKSAKRKAEEEDDDFLELDFDTPEPKRRRPSPG